MKKVLLLLFVFLLLLCSYSSLWRRSTRFIIPTKQTFSSPRSQRIGTDLIWMQTSCHGKRPPPFPALTNALSKCHLSELSYNTRGDNTRGSFIFSFKINTVNNTRTKLNFSYFEPRKHIMFSTLSKNIHIHVLEFLWNSVQLIMLQQTWWEVLHLENIYKMKHPVTTHFITETFLWYLKLMRKSYKFGYRTLYGVRDICVTQSIHMDKR